MVKLIIATSKNNILQLIIFYILNRNTICFMLIKKFIEYLNLNRDLNMNKHKTKNSLNKNNKSRAARNKANKKHLEVNKIDPTNKVKYTKVEYCPIIAKMLKQNNMKIKSPIVFSFLDYLNLYEKLVCRAVCRQWNELIKQKLPFLGKENFLECVLNKSTMTSYKKYLTTSHKKHDYDSNIKSNDININDRLLFDNSNQKFSKKKVLVKLISSKNFNLIKSKISLGEMTKAKNLTDDEMQWE